MEDYPVTIGALEQVNWGTPRFGEHYQSEGPRERLDGTFVFEAGVFGSGFTPTAANVDEWADQWTPVSSSPYNADLRFVTGSYTVTEAESPSLEGQRGYIWGFNGKSSGSEWILATEPSWTWPAAWSTGLPTFWTIGASTTAIVGRVSVEGMDLQTAKIVLGESDSARWLHDILDWGHDAELSVGPATVTARLRIENEADSPLFLHILVTLLGGTPFHP